MEGLGYGEKNRSAGMRDPDDKNGIKAVIRFTNTAVARFDGAGGGVLATAPADRPGYSHIWTERP